MVPVQQLSNADAAMLTVSWLDNIVVAVAMHAVQMHNAALCLDLLICACPM
jgi:hypothetical protein